MKNFVLLLANSKYKNEWNISHIPRDYRAITSLLLAHKCLEHGTVNMTLINPKLKT